MGIGRRRGRGGWLLGWGNIGGGCFRYLGLGMLDFLGGL